MLFTPRCDWNPLGGGRGEKPPYMLSRLPDGSSDFLLAVAPDRRLGEDDPAYDLAGELENRRRVGEARRLLYVALTRAGGGST